MQNKRLVLALFTLMGLVMQGIALDAWLSEVSCYASNKYSSGGCLFGHDAKMAALFISWIGVLLFVPLFDNRFVVKAALISWFVGVLIALWFFVLH